jgi:uncharacterized LabA/DUF88 family protein
MQPVESSASSRHRARQRALATLSSDYPSWTDWLDYNGYTVVTKAAKKFIDASGRRKVRGNMDIELAVDAMELAEHVD